MKVRRLALVTHPERTTAARIADEVHQFRSTSADVVREDDGQLAGERCRRTVLPFLVEFVLGGRLGGDPGGRHERRDDKCPCERK